MRPPKGVPIGRCPSQKEPLTCQVPSQGAPSICDHPMVTQPVGVQRKSSSARGNNMAKCAACDALCCYGCGPKRKPTRWPTSEPTIVLHLRYPLPSQLITPMACKGRAAIPHCPPLPSLMSAARPSYDGTRDGACHVAGTRASTLICVAAPGPAWEESMSPADFILLTNWFDSPCSAQPHPLRDFGSRVTRSEYCPVK